MRELVDVDFPEAERIRVDPRQLSPAGMSRLNTIARAETGINRPAPPPFSFIMARRRRW